MSTIIGASITASVTLTAALLAYVFGRLQKAFEVRYTSFYERQAEVTSELYSLVYTISKEFKTWLSLQEGDDGSASTSEQLNKQKSAIEEAIKKFRSCYIEHDLWISKETWDKLDNLHKELDEQWLSVELPTRGSDEKEEIESWIETRFPRIRDDLRSEFHKALKVEDIQSSESKALIRGLWHVAIGLLGTLSLGLGAGILLSYSLDNYRVGISTGLLVGLGIGLILEYARPTKESKKQ